MDLSHLVATESMVITAAGTFYPDQSVADGHTETADSSSLLDSDNNPAVAAIIHWVDVSVGTTTTPAGELTVVIDSHDGTSENLWTGAITVLVAGGESYLSGACRGLKVSKERGFRVVVAETAGTVDIRVVVGWSPLGNVRTANIGIND